MSADPGFVDWSLGQAVRGTFPGARIPAGPRVCIGAGAVSPLDWICLDVREDYPDANENVRSRVLGDGYGRMRWDSSGTRLLELLDGLQPSVVYAHHVIEHIPVVRWVETLRSWARVLRPGGILYLCQPDLTAIAARVLEGMEPGAAAPWFDADPKHRTWPGDTRAGLTLHDHGEGSAWFWIYAGGDHRSVPTEIHVQQALLGCGVNLKRYLRDLSRVGHEYRLFVSLEACYVGRKEGADVGASPVGG